MRLRTKKASKKDRINILIDHDKKTIFDELLRENNESKTEVILKCIDRYIDKKSKQ